MNHPLHSPHHQQSSPSPSSSGHTAQHPRSSREDWHQYTLTGSPSPAHYASPEGIHFHPNRHHPLPGSRVGPQPQRYESLTGLLLQSGSNPSFGVGADDESCKHMSMGDDGSVTLDDSGGQRRRGGRCRFGCLSCGYDSPPAILTGLLCLGAAGALLGALFPSSSSSGGPASSVPSVATGYASWDVISDALGYTYFLAWTLSFYPQIITNWRHPSKARTGVSLDFVVWNIVGFACYAIYTTSFRYSDVVRREYAERFGANQDAGGDYSDNLQNVTSAFVNTILLAKGHHHHDNSTVDDSSSTFGDHGSNATSGDDASGSNAAAAAVPQVKANDVAFAWHALLLTIVTFVQIAWCSGGRGKRDEYAFQSAAGDESIAFEGEEDEINFDNSILSGEEGSFLGGGGTLRSINIDEEEEDDDERNSIVGVADIQLEQRRRWELDRHWTRRISSATKCLVLLLLLICVAGGVIVAANVDIGYEREGGEGWQWIDYLYFLSFVKVGVSIVKYIPQVVLNYRRKSTSGWQIWNILLDFTGGTLSIVQLVGDSAAEARRRGLPHAWTGIAGNPAKLGLGSVSIVFDVVFLFQHYVLYRRPSPRRRPRDDGNASSNRDYETPLLSDQ